MTDKYCITTCLYYTRKDDCCFSNSLEMEYQNGFFSTHFYPVNVTFEYEFIIQISFFLHDYAVQLSKIPKV